MLFGWNIQNGIVLQYTTDNEHQFYVDKNEHYYYQGILEYYVHTNEGYLNLATGSIKELNAQDYSFSPNDFYVNEVAINETDIDTCSATEGPVILNKTTRLYNCNKEVNFPLFYPDKTAEELAECPGVCGSVAVGIMLECYDDYYTDLPDGYSFIDSDVKMSNAYCEDIYGLELVKRLIPYIEPGANGSYFLNPGVSSYFADRGISGGAQLGVLAVYLQTKDSIGANGTGYPLIVATSNHFMVGIGYQNTTQKQIYVNNGRGGKEWVNANTIVCTWTFMISGTM